MKKLMLAIDDKDDDLKDGGPLATRTWKLGSVAITVKSGYGEYQGFHISNSGPSLVVHSAEYHFVTLPEFKGQFDVVAFEAILTEAKTELQRMKDYLANQFNALLKKEII